MKPTQVEAVRHLSDVISHYEVVYKWPTKVKDFEETEIYVRLRAALTRWAPPDSDYARECERVLSLSKAVVTWKTEQLYAIARSLKRDYLSTFISASFAALVRTEVFGDFLEMADHLLVNGYKDPAAVVVGAVLEEHIRRLCVLHSIAISEKGKPRTADSLNIDLASKTIYSKLDQKSITAWQDLRNKAAHGQFSAYGDAQVDLMLKGVREFISRYPA